MTEMYTHSVWDSHFLCTSSLRDIQTRTHMAQSVCSAHVTSLPLTLSILMFHPPSLLFPHGHFDIPVCTFLADLFLIRKRGSSALPNEKRGVWLPGRSHALHKLWAQRVRQDHFCRWWHDAHQRSELRLHLWLLENHTREHWTVGCSLNVWSLCFARFSWWVFSSGRKQRQHASGNRC